MQAEGYSAAASIKRTDLWADPRQFKEALLAAQLRFAFNPTSAVIGNRRYYGQRWQKCDHQLFRRFKFWRFKGIYRRFKQCPYYGQQSLQNDSVIRKHYKNHTFAGGASVHQMETGFSGRPRYVRWSMHFPVRVWRIFWKCNRPDNSRRDDRQWKAKKLNRLIGDYMLGVISETAAFISGAASFGWQSAFDKRVRRFHIRKCNWRRNRRNGTRAETKPRLQSGSWSWLWSTRGQETNGTLSDLTAGITYGSTVRSAREIISRLITESGLKPRKAGRYWNWRPYTVLKRVRHCNCGYQIGTQYQDHLLFSIGRVWSCFFIPNEMPLFQHTVSFVQAIHAFCHRILPSDEKRRNMSMDMDMNGHYDHHPKQPKQKEETR